MDIDDEHKFSALNVQSTESPKHVRYRIGTALCGSKFGSATLSLRYRRGSNPVTLFLYKMKPVFCRKANF